MYIYIMYLDMFKMICNIIYKYIYMYMLLYVHMLLFIYVISDIQKLKKPHNDLVTL